MFSKMKSHPLSVEKWGQEDGATAVEYGLLVGLIAVFLIAAMTQLGSSVSETFEKAACKVSGKYWIDATKQCSTTPPAP